MYLKFLILEEQNTVVQSFFVMLVIGHYIDVGIYIRIVVKCMWFCILKKV